jgi:hypothetical protein
MSDDRLPGFACIDCDECTAHIREYYMVLDAVWKLAGMWDIPGMLCIGCLEARIRRELAPEDFTECPLNDEFVGKSERLQRRLLGRDESAWVCPSGIPDFVPLYPNSTTAGEQTVDVSR